jgi:hypothetical protein
MGSACCQVLCTAARCSVCCLHSVGLHNNYCSTCLCPVLCLAGAALVLCGCCVLQCAVQLGDWRIRDTEHGLHDAPAARGLQGQVRCSMLVKLGQTCLWSSSSLFVNRRRCLTLCVCVAPVSMAASCFPGQRSLQAIVYSGCGCSQASNLLPVVNGELCAGTAMGVLQPATMLHARSASFMGACLPHYGIICPAPHIICVHLCLSTASNQLLYFNSARCHSAFCSVPNSKSCHA